MIRLRENNEVIKKALETLQADAHPTNEQKEWMLKNILVECRKEEKLNTFILLKQWITIYPWRFAFATSAVQAIVFTIIYGTKYTNLFLGFYGG